MSGIIFLRQRRFRSWWSQSKSWWQQQMDSCALGLCSCLHWFSCIFGLRSPLFMHPGRHAGSHLSLLGLTKECSLFLLVLGMLLESHPWAPAVGSPGQFPFSNHIRLAMQHWRSLAVSAHHAMRPTRPFWNSNCRALTKAKSYSLSSSPGCPRSPWGPKAGGESLQHRALRLGGGSQQPWLFSLAVGSLKSTVCLMASCCKRVVGSSPVHNAGTKRGTDQPPVRWFPHPCSICTLIQSFGHLIGSGMVSCIQAWLHWQL